MVLWQRAWATFGDLAQDISWILRTSIKSFGLLIEYWVSCRFAGLYLTITLHMKLSVLAIPLWAGTGLLICLDPTELLKFQ